MIFKTFDNDIDKWTAKIGILGKSFNELGNAVRVAFKTTIDNIDNFDEDISFWDALKNNLIPKNEDGISWLKNSLGEIVSAENINSYIAELDLDSAKEQLKSIFNHQQLVSENKATWQDYFDTLEDGSEHYIPDLIKNTEDLSKLTGDDLVKANQQARSSALAHNNALKAQTLGAKAASLAMKGLTLALNVGVMILATKVIEGTVKAIDNYVNSAENTTEALNSSADAFKDSTSEITDYNSELETTNERITELQRLADNGTISLADKDELETLKEQNAELERKIVLKKQERALEAEQLLKDLDAVKGRNYTTFDGGFIKESAITALWGYINQYDWWSNAENGFSEKDILKDKNNMLVAADAVNQSIEAYKSLIDAGFADELDKDYQSLLRVQNAYLKLLYDINQTEENFRALDSNNKRDVLSKQLKQQRGFSDEKIESIISSISDEDLNKFYDKVLSFPEPSANDYETIEEYGKAYTQAWLKGIESEAKDNDNKTSILSLDEKELEAIDAYQEKLSLITKLRTEWADANASERMDLRESISKLFSNFDLSLLSDSKDDIEDILGDLGMSALNTIEGQIDGYTTQFIQMFTEAFGSVNITPYIEKVEELRNLLSGAKSGKVYNFDEFTAITQNNKDLLDSFKEVEGGYKLEEDAVISLLNTSITAYNEIVSSQRYTTDEILKEKQKLIEIYGIEAEILNEIAKLQSADNPHDWSSVDNLIHAYSLTPEQIAMLEQYAEFISNIKEKYDSLYETIDDENGSGSSSSNNSIDWLSNSIENLQENIDDLQRAFENTKGFDEQLKALNELTDGLKELQNVYYSDVDNSNTVYGEYENRYKEALGKLGGDASSIQSKIEAGDVFNTQDFSSDVADIINDAIDAWNGMKDAHNKYLELGVEIDDKRLQSYEIQRKPFEANIANLEGEKQKIQNKIDLNGGQGTVEQYKQLIGIEEEIRKSLTERLEMENKILSTLKPNTDEYVEQEQTIRDIENGLDDCAKNTKDWGLELLKLPLREIESVINGLSSQLQSVETEMSEMDAIIAGAQAYIQDQIDLQEELKKPIQEQLDALREANDERERALVLERAKGELDRLLNQNTVKLYNGEQVIYTRDEKAIRDAKENLTNLEYEETVRQLEKQLEYYDDIIADLQEVKDKWGNIAQEAEDYLNIQKALGSIGIDGIFDASVIDNFTRSYTKLTQTKDSLDDQISDWEAYQKAIQETVTQYEYGMISFEECQGKLAELTEDFCRKIDEDGKVSAEKISEIVNNILVKFELINVEEKTTKVEQDLSEAEKKTLEATKNMNDSIDDVGENADDTATGVTGTLETETEVQLELMKSFAEEMTATFQSMCDSVVSSTTIAFQSLSANIIATANLVQEQINAMISNSQSGISELEGLLSKASNFNEKYGLSSGNSTPITVSYADDLKINDKFSKGGLITKYDKELDSVAKNMGEDHIAHIAFQEGERILTPAENTLWEKIQNSSFDLIQNNIVPISSVMPRYDITPISKLNTSTPVLQSITVNCPNVTNEHGYNNLIKTIEGLPLKAQQYANRR